MEKFAVIRTGGKQYLIKPGDVIKIEKLKKPEKEGGVFYFDKVLLTVDGDKVEIGKPFLENSKVSAEWLKEDRAKKISILRYHSKTRYRRKKGHRQIYSQIRISAIGGSASG